MEDEERDDHNHPVTSFSVEGQATLRSHVEVGETFAKMKNRCKYLSHIFLKVRKIRSR
jgi:hypothetical protein